MLLSESAIKRCLEIIVAAQTPWGEWGSIANELKRTQRVKRYTNLNNFNIPIIPKPNGFRTLLAVEILGNWISDGDGYQEVLDSVHRWFETSFDHGWIQIHKIIQSGIVGSIGNQGPAYVIESVSDIRHTAQAIEFFCRYSSLNAEHYDTIRNIIKNQNDGSWSFELGKKSETVFTTLSSLRMIESILRNKNEFTNWLATDSVSMRRLRDSHRDAVTFFNKNMFINEQCKSLFDVAVCINRLHDIFKDKEPSLNEEALKFIHNSWNKENEYWRGREQDDEKELNALLYATFSKLSNLQERNNRHKLQSVTKYLEETLTTPIDITTALFALMGHQTICQKMNIGINKRTLNEIKSSESFCDTRNAFYFHYFSSRLMSLISLMEMQSSDNNWNRAFKKEKEKTIHIANSLSLLSKEDKALKTLIDGIEDDNWIELHEKISIYFSSIKLLKASSTPWVNRIINEGKEILLELSSRTLSHMLKSP